MTVSPHFLFNAIKSKTRIIHVCFLLDQNNIEKGWGGGLFVPLILFKGDSSDAQMFGNWWNCLNSFVRGCSSRERPSVLGRSSIRSIYKSFSESCEVQLAGILNVVSNNEPTIMHVPAPITWCRPRGAY